MPKGRPKVSRNKLTGPMRDAVAFAEAHGYTLVAGRKHYHLRKPGFPPLDVPVTSSDWRTPRNIRAQVSRAEPRPGRAESA